ncbi:hypothetical protein GUA87_16005 [Sneathiella sp. P13V-1]|uniref:hypothetical protein n=1 Tax=Sneathiella sp. P13V-1 TaxID=2697366 RepID=UPI00187B359C|nr:hypothetical protein [Sneathiella sp. P13V-1]MBE7638362.1 hypothetical protein [Sneathiella sp. P13V-1]
MTSKDYLDEVFETELQGSVELAKEFQSALFENNSPRELSGNLYSFSPTNENILIENLFDEEDVQSVSAIIFKERLESYIKRIG